MTIEETFSHDLNNGGFVITEDLLHHRIERVVDFMYSLREEYCEAESDEFKNDILKTMMQQRYRKEMLESMILNHINLSVN